MNNFIHVPYGEHYDGFAEWIARQGWTVYRNTYRRLNGEMAHHGLGERAVIDIYANLVGDYYAYLDRLEALRGQTGALDLVTAS